MVGKRSGQVRSWLGRQQREKRRRGESQKREVGGCSPICTAGADTNAVPCPTPVAAPSAADVTDLRGSRSRALQTGRMIGRQRREQDQKIKAGHVKWMGVATRAITICDEAPLGWSCTPRLDPYKQPLSPVGLDILNNCYRHDSPRPAPRLVRQVFLPSS